MKKKTIVLCTMLIILSTMGYAQQDSISVCFRFVAGNDEFYSPYQQNAENLKEISDFIDKNRDAIASGKAPIMVNGYCATSDDKQQKIEPKTMSNRVKSEMIIHNGMKEAYFKTSNTTEPYGKYGNAVVVVIALPTENHTASPTTPVQEEIAQEESVADDSQPQDTVQPLPEQPQVEPEGSAEEPTAAQQPQDTAQDVQNPVEDQPTWSLRTNLLYWVVGTPNIGAEWKATPKIGVVVNGGYAPWANNSWEHNWGGWFVSPEVRFYLGNGGRWFVGPQLLVGGFNLKPKDTGRMGSMTGGGVVAGYKFALSRTFDMDFTLGAGYVHLKYDTYRQDENGMNVYTNYDTKKDCLAPIQAGVSLIYKIQ